MQFKFILSSIALAGLAACGGGTTGGGASYTDVLSDFRSSDVIADANSETAEGITFDNLLAGGSATYSGQSLIYLSEDFPDTTDQEVSLDGPDDLPDPTLAGTVSLQTTFGEGNGRVTGSFGNFVDSDGNEKNGSLTISNGEIEDLFGSAAMAGNFAGTLSGSGAGSRSYSGDLVGFFTPSGVFGLGTESLEEDVNDDASFALFFVAE